MVAGAPPEHVPPYLTAQRSRYAALLTIASGDGATDVEVELHTAIDRLRDLGYSYWLARAQAELARWLDRRQRPDEAAHLLAEAGETFTRLGVSKVERPS
jgi:hypothetical protein